MPWIEEDPLWVQEPYNPENGIVHIKDDDELDCENTDTNESTDDITTPNGFTQPSLF